jgi:hypothetical protein
LVFSAASADPKAKVIPNTITHEIRNNFFIVHSSLLLD